MLNIACLEKVQKTAKQIAAVLGSVKIDMVRAILLKVQKPVFSNVGRGHGCDGSFYQYVKTSFEGLNNGLLIMRCVNNIIKVLSVQPKSISFYEERTSVSSKGSNPYVEGGLVLAARSLFGYSVLKDTTRRRRPVYNQFRYLATGPGRTTNVTERLNSLYDRAKLTDSKIDRKLYRDYILNKDMYLAAYQKLRSSPGMMTPGVDPITLDGLSPVVIQDLINKLSSGEFQFTPGRRVEIPKANGKTRPLIVGSPRDKLVQEVIRMVLETIYEPIFKDVSHGFRPKRGCHSALRQIYTKFVGCT